MQNIRESLADPDQPGTYLWDKLDGFEGEEHNSLEKSPDLQEKVRLAIMQGFIDPEEFNGVRKRPLRFNGESWSLVPDDCAIRNFDMIFY
jgi:hypothetical protein